MKKTISLLMMSLILVSCSSGQKNHREYQISAYHWYQTSAEVKAMLYQTYNLAKLQIENELKKKSSKKRAVIFDIDETILDNSYAGAYEIKNNMEWNEGLFGDWVKLKKATALPGALDFIKFLESKKIEVFYVSNRRDTWFEETYENLVNEGFPVKRSNLMLKKEVSSKEVRRLEIAKNHNIVMLLGDNLIDHDQRFDGASFEERERLVDQFRAEFGTKFIVLPNPMYGDWERALPKDQNIYDHLKVVQ